MRLHKCGQSPSLCQSPEQAKPPRPAGFSSITPLPQPGAQTGRIAVESISLPLFLFHSEQDALFLPKDRLWYPKNESSLRFGSELNSLELGEKQQGWAPGALRLEFKNSIHCRKIKAFS